MMFFSRRRDRKNRELTDTGTIWQVLMPSLATELLERIEHTGNENGRNGVQAIDKKGLESALKLRLTKERLQKKAEDKFLQKQISALEGKLNLVKEKIEQLRRKVQEQREIVTLIEGLILTSAAVIYVLGEFVFSHQLILENWGLGRSEPFIWIPLVLALTMATVFCKLVYARFVETKYSESASYLPQIVKWFFLVSTSMVVLSFLYFGYVRGIGFKFQMLETGQDIYEALYQAHPHLNTIAFILLAFLFLVGGAVLLTAGLNELKKWFLYRGDKRELKRLEKKEQGMESSLDRLNEESHEAEALNAHLNDDKAFNEIVVAQVELYSSIYSANYGKGLKEMLTDLDDEQSLDGKFHLFVHKALEQMAINSTIMKEYQNGR